MPCSQCGRKGHNSRTCFGSNEEEYMIDQEFYRPVSEAEVDAALGRAYPNKPKERKRKKRDYRDEHLDRMKKAKQARAKRLQNMNKQSESWCSIL